MGVGLVVAALLTLMQGVSCQNWGATLPRSILAISGSCVTVPCRFQVIKSEEKSILNCSNGGIWNKGNIAGPAIFSARNPAINKVQGEIVGDITEKNCTTTFHNIPQDFGGVFFFRIDCLEILKYTFKNIVNISVQTAPSPPRLTSVGQLAEGARVRLLCSVPVPCSVLPPSVTWLPRDDSMREETQVYQDADGLETLTSTLTFTAAAYHHNQSVTCSVSYPLTEGGSSQPSASSHRLSILYAPRFTVATVDAFPPVPVGRAVTFTCWSDANPPVSTYTWYRVDTGQATKTGDGETLTLKVREGDSGLYLCEARTQRGSQRSRPVSLEISAAGGSSESLLMISCIICGVLFVFYILTVVVGVRKYQSLSRRLKQVEVKGDHTYTDLRTCNVSPDYDQLQLNKQPKTTAPPEVPKYENIQKFPPS